MEEDLEDLYESAPCGYLSLRPDGYIVKVNQTFCRWTGYAHDDLIGKRLHDILSIASRIFYETHFAPLLRMQGFFDEVALDFRKQNREPFSVLVNAAERKDAEGNPQFIRLTVFNATDRRRYEKELLNARDEQRAEGDLREQFIAVLGHDLRNPLASIVAGMRLVQKSKLDDRAQSILAMMHRSAVRMQALIDNVLDFARGRLGGGLTLTLSAEPLEPVLQQVVDELQSAHPDAVINTEFALTKPFKADPIRIGQLFSNLLGNALTHGAENEPVQVTAQTTDAFELRVCNAGNPIPQAAMERLFMPFSRGEVRASQQGLGLGLYIANEIARAHGGRIDVSSTAELTCFTFTMPLPRSP